MNIKRIGVALAALVATVSFSACTENEPKSPASETSVATLQPPQVADLSNLSIAALSGDVPAALPTWKRGGDAVKYSLNTLRFLVASANKSGGNLPTIKYAIYQGDYDTPLLTCPDGGNPHLAVLPKDTQPAIYCYNIGVLLVPNDWDYDPFDVLVETLAVALAGEALENRHYCFEGLLYGSVAHLQPALKNTLADKVKPLSSTSSVWAEKERLRQDVYKRVSSGLTHTC